MSYEKLLRDTATYWAPLSNDGTGDMTFSPPVRTRVRWEDHNERFDDNDGKSFVSAAIVYTTIEIEQDGWLYLGSSTAADPQLIEDAFRVRRISSTHTPNRSITVRKAVLG